MKIVLDLAGFGSFRIVDNGVFVGLGGVLVLEVSGNSAAGASWSASRSKPTLFSCSSRVCRSIASCKTRIWPVSRFLFPSLGADYRSIQTTHTHKEKDGKTIENECPLH